MNQTYKNLEIILVDDSSPDNCPAMCDEWAEKDSRIRVIHKENGGVSSARNAGLDTMKGTLVGFIDSDDYIELDMYEKLYNALAENDADMSVCSLWDIDENGNPFPQQWNPVDKNLISGVEALADIYHMHSVVWNKLYKREIFSSLRFEVEHVNIIYYQYEDDLIIHHILGQCNKIAVIKDRLYFYVQNSANSMSRASRGKGIINAFRCSVYVLKDRLNYLQNFKEYVPLDETIGSYYGTLINILRKVNFLQYRRDIWPFFLDTSHKLIKSGKIKNWLRIVKLVLVLFRSMFRPFIKEE